MLAKQGETGVFQNYRSCKDYTNFFLALIFFLGYVKRTLCEFQTFLLAKHATFFFDALSQAFFYLAVFEMLMYGLDM